MKQFDYIIAGAGASGLSLLVQMIRSGNFDNKKILLVDRQQKNLNDRTWCFWEKEEGPFEQIVHTSYNSLKFIGNNQYEIARRVHPYSYKLIRGIDFYNYCFSIVSRTKNVEIVYGEVEHLDSNEDGASIFLHQQQYHAKYIFNSIPYKAPVTSGNIYSLLQHFKGWFIETSEPKFDESTATLMDFRTSQHRGTAFFYVMPFSRTSALVEYTLFTPDVLNDSDYDSGLTEYCSAILGLPDSSYRIVAAETGSIPMTNFSFPVSEGHIINIGTAGGRTRPSSGYTFRYIQQHSAAIVKLLQEGKFPAVARFNARHKFFDSVLLNILSSGKMEGAAIFTQLFSRNQMQQVFRFLDGESSLLEDLRLISTLPVIPFSLAALNHSSKKKSSKP